jgi:hypothetical protein
VDVVRNARRSPSRGWAEHPSAARSSNGRDS